MTRYGWGALFLGAALAFSGSALAQQSSPTQGVTAPANAAAPARPADWNQPPEWSAASERPQYASVPGIDTNRLIQGAGREWREIRNGPLTQVGGWVLVIALALLALFYVVKGPIRLRGHPTGRLIERFSVVERASHWVMAISFVLLALSGLVIMFGKHLILPWLGYTGFAWLTVVAKNLHNFVGPLFILSIVVFFLIYVKDNLLNRRDFTWLAKLGGMLGKEEVPSGRFNGGEKAWFWAGVVVLGTAVSVTGLILDFPNWNQGRQAMQQANLVHAIAALVFIALSFAHIYLGTIGMEGAYRGMRDGVVDETWAREHHAIWYEAVKATGSARRTGPDVTLVQPAQASAD
jgi:formate dehydrogenase subunit gamma